MNLRDFLTGLAGSGVLGVAGFVLMAYLEKKWAWVAGLEAWLKRLMAWTVSGLVGVIPFLGMVLMQHVPAPVGWRAWVEALFVYVYIALAASQGAHAIDKTRKDRVAKR